MPEQTAAHVEDFDVDIHVGADVIMCHDEGRLRGSRVLRCVDTVDLRGQTLDDFEVEGDGRRVVQDVPCTELEGVVSFGEFRQAVACRA